uniref:Uncharacterized protein n=1 Tax=Agrobacterium albertimagni TaxID=147266 RepID=A0A7C1NYM8_9HYPH
MAHVQQRDQIKAAQLLLHLSLGMAGVGIFDKDSSLCVPPDLLRCDNQAVELSLGGMSRLPEQRILWTVGDRKDITGSSHLERQIAAVVGQKAVGVFDPEGSGVWAGSEILELDAQGAGLTIRHAQGFLLDLLSLIQLGVDDDFRCVLSGRTGCCHGQSDDRRLIGSNDLRFHLG